MRRLSMRVQRRLIFEIFDRCEGVTPVNIDIEIEAYASGSSLLAAICAFPAAIVSSSFPGFTFTVHIILRIWVILRDPRMRSFAPARAKGKPVDGGLRLMQAGPLFEQTKSLR